MSKNKVLFLGTGSFGLALATAVSRGSGVKSTILARDKYLADYINKNHSHPSKLGNNAVDVYCTTDCDTAIKSAEDIFLCTPSTAIHSVTNMLQRYALPNVNIILCSKGFNAIAFQNIQSENDFDPLLSSVIQTTLPQANVSILSGPNFADEILSCTPTITTVASRCEKASIKVRDIFRNTNVKIKISDDLVGVQCAGACKNIIAIAVGILQGLHNFNDVTLNNYNQMYFLIMEMIDEVIAIMERIGGKKNTMLSPAGIGDIMLTCSSKKSRNKNFGIDLGLAMRQIATNLNNVSVHAAYKLHSQTFSNQLSSFMNKSRNNLVEGYEATRLACQLSEVLSLSSKHIFTIQSILHNHCIADNFLDVFE